MSKLTAKKRRVLPAKAFAYPKQRKYPIHDAGHRTAALREAAKSSTFGTFTHVKRQVCKKAPGMPSCRNAGGARRTR